MADNVTVTAGVGTTIAADEVTDGTLGLVKVQYVKLMDGTIDGTAKVGTGNGTAASAIRATLASDGTGVVGLNAGQNSVGNVGSKTVTVTVTPTLTGTAYGTNYVLGGIQTFAGAFTSTNSGTIQSIAVNIKKVEAVTFTFTPFSAQPANAMADNAAAAINSADVNLVRPPIVLASSSILGTHTMATAAGIGESINSSGTSLYGVLTCSAAMTNNLAAGDITISVTILQDA